MTEEFGWFRGDWVCMSHLELGVLLLWLPPPSKVTEREHNKWEGTWLKSREMSRKTMFDF